MNIKAMLAVVLFLMVVVGIILGVFFFPIYTLVSITSLATLSCVIFIADLFIWLSKI